MTPVFREALVMLCLAVATSTSQSLPRLRDDRSRRDWFAYEIPTAKKFSCRPGLYLASVPRYAKAALAVASQRVGTQVREVLDL